jgi:hypothetical protein
LFPVHFPHPFFDYIDRDDLILYTITSDSILRIFLPVLDSPRRLQLHASLDIFAALPFSVASGLSSSKSAVFWLDREVVGDTLKGILGTTALDVEDGERKRLKDIQDEGWDLFLRVSGDGSIVVSAVAVGFPHYFCVRSSSHGV